MFASDMHLQLFHRLIDAIIKEQIDQYDADDYVLTAAPCR